MKKRFSKPNISHLVPWAGLLILSRSVGLPKDWRDSLDEIKAKQTVILAHLIQMGTKEASECKKLFWEVCRKHDELIYQALIAAGKWKIGELEVNDKL